MEVLTYRPRPLCHCASRIYISGAVEATLDWSGRTVVYGFCKEGEAKCMHMCPSAGEIDPSATRSARTVLFPLYM